MLKILYETSALLDEDGVNAIEIMIVYHDVVYKLGREKGWNESESAVIAGKQLTAAGYGSVFVELVTEGIECTTHHTVPESLSNWGDIIWPLIDIDLLAGFGTTWEEFSENTRLIGLEFSPLYTEQEYASGRAKFASSFLERPKIFHTPGFFKYEPIVRENLARMAAMG
jgi:predicted metal-dependent HD superfamily phosphohydrolase